LWRAQQMLFKVAIAAFALAQSPAQTPQAQPPAADEQPLLLRSNTRLVEISVIVHDRKGEPVSDLKKEDFIVTEKGKPQPIQLFSVESTGKLSAPAEKLPPHIFSNRLDSRSGVPNSVTVILLDLLNTRWQDQVYAKQKLIKFLEQIHPEDRVALYTLGRSLKVLHDYTTDSRQLLERLHKFHGQNLPDISASEPDTGDPLNLLELGYNRGESDFFTKDRVFNTLIALESIAGHLASLPGRKNLIWLSGGFPLQIGFDEIPEVKGPPQERRSFTDEVNHAIRALNNANIAMYPVDARGLIMGSDFAGAESHAPPKRNPLKPVVSNLDTMQELAGRTGGRASYNRNDIDNAIRKAMEDARVTYTLGYYPANPEADGKFHEIKVKVDRPGMDVRYRKGYFAMREVSQDEKTRKSQLAGAVWSPLDATAVGLNARVDIIDKPAPNTVNVFTQMDPANIKLEQKNDHWVGRVDLIFMQKDDQGRQLPGGITNTLELNLSKESYLKMLKGGLVYRTAFPRQPNSVNLRIAVRDAGTGSVGSVSIPFSQVVN